MNTNRLDMADVRLCEAVAQAYRTRLITVKEVALEFGVSQVTAREMIRLRISDKDFDMLKATRYKQSKLGEKNPQFGNFRASDCEDADGYLTRLVEGRRYPVQQIVMSELLGIHPSKFPATMVVHHIDENKQNNAPNNLAMTTRAGHARIHERYQSPGEDLVLKKLNLRECIEFMISR